jgi:hypothetical protein
LARMARRRCGSVGRAREDRWEAHGDGGLHGGLLQARKFALSPPVLSRERDWAVHAQTECVQAQAQCGFGRAPPLPRVIWAGEMSRLRALSSNGFTNGTARRFTHQVNSHPPGSPSRQIHVPTRLCWPRKEGTVRVDNGNRERDVQTQMQGVTSSRLHITLPRQHVSANQGSGSKFCSSRRNAKQTIQSQKKTNSLSSPPDTTGVALVRGHDPRAQEGTET